MTRKDSKDSMDEQLYRAIIDSLPYALLVLNKELQIVLYNSAPVNF